MELTRSPLLKSTLKTRWPQFILFALMLTGFLLSILSGFIGTPVGSRNFGIVFTWIAWWAVLILVAVPFLGRGWCAVCPIPLPGEWLQRGQLLGPRETGSGSGMNRRWPNKLRNIWLQNVTFTLVALFSSVILTTPVVSSIVLAAMLFLALGLSLVFERRTFCRYLCPVSGFIGLYSQTAPLELRVKDKSVCSTCEGKPCYNGNAAGYGCPWDVFPGGLAKNTFCGLCLECLRTCPHDNIAVNLRPFSADLHKPAGRRMDEAFKAFIMLGAALVYAAVLLGPWGGWKAAAYVVGTLPWLGYAAAFLGFVFGLLPTLFLLAVSTGRLLSGNSATPRQVFVSFSYALVPLGLTAWVSFSLSFVLTNAAYILAALSDPFGWGWNLFGTAGQAWTPYMSNLLPFLQVGMLLAGLAWSVRTALKIAAESLAGRRMLFQSAPVVLFCLAVTTGLLVLLV